MSSVFQGLLDTNGRINVGVGPVVSYFRGLPLNASGQVVVGAGPITRFDQGIPFNAAGEVVGLQTTEPSSYGPGATPYGPNGELCVEPSGTIARYYQGVPYNAGGVYCAAGGTSAWTPAALFAAGEQGAWYDPSDFSTMFTDRAGSTQVTAVEQTVGLILDKSKGLVLGSELVTTTNLIAQNSNGTVTVSGSTVICTCTVAGLYGARFNPVPNAVAGRTYVIEVNISSNSASKLIRLDYGGLTNQTVVASGTGGNIFRIASIGGSLSIYVATGLVGESFTISLVSVKELAGNHATAPSDAARPVLRARQNLLTYSEQFDNAAWTKSGCSITPNAVTAPDGSLTADKLVENDLNSIHRLQFPFTTITGAVYTFSVYVKAAERTWAWLYDDVANGYVYFDLTSGTVGTKAAGYTSVNIEAAGNGWYRISGTATEAAGNAGNFMFGPAAGDNLPGYQGDNASGIYCWGAQLVTGSEAKPYQRIEAATVYDSDPTKFPYYLDFDGVDDSLATAAVDFSATDKMSVFAGVTKDGSSDDIIVELGPTTTGTNGSFYLGSDLFASTAWDIALRGTVTCGKYATGYTAPVTSVFSALLDIAASAVADEIIMRIDGAAIAGTTSGTSAGTGNFSSNPLYIGARAGPSITLDGRIFSLIVRGAASSAAEIDAAEDWVAAKTGVTLP